MSKVIERLQEDLSRLTDEESDVIHENANKDPKRFTTMRDLTAGTVARHIGLSMLPEHVKEAHVKGEIHFHDLDYHPYQPMTNCCLIDIDHMLKNGFVIGNAHVNPPQSIQTAAAQISQIIANVSSSQYGGCSIDRIDEVLSKFAQINALNHKRNAEQFVTLHLQDDYVKRMTEKDIYDAMQSLEYEINTLYTSNGQTPFVTFGFGLGTDVYARMIQHAILSNRLAGLGKEKVTAIFPKLVFSIKDGVNFKAGDPNYDIKQLALQCSSKRMYPDILNYKALTDLIGDFKVPMGCRSFLNLYEEDGKAVNSGRCNLGVVTLNLPRIALESKDTEQFLSILRTRLDIIKEACLYRIHRLKDATTENAPILYLHGAFGKSLRPDDDVIQLFTHRRATISIGYIGLYEVGAALFHPNWETDEKAKSFVEQVLITMKQYAEQLTEQYDVQFSIYGTPSESLTHRFCTLDYEKFGTIEHITDKGYYTNSFHYDTRKTVTPFEKLSFEQRFAKHSLGGFIHYCEYPDLKHNLKALEAVWDYSYDKVGYLGTNLPIDKCFECGFEGEFEATADGFMCPHCHNTDPETTDVIKRTCGYLGQPLKRPMIKGRHKEIQSRVKHMRSV